MQVQQDREVIYKQVLKVDLIMYRQEIPIMVVVHNQTHLLLQLPLNQLQVDQDQVLILLPEPIVHLLILLHLALLVRVEARPGEAAEVHQEVEEVHQGRFQDHVNFNLYVS